MMRTHESSLTKRIAAAAAAAAVLFTATPAIAAPQTTTVAATTEQTWTVTDETGNTIDAEPAVTVTETKTAENAPTQAKTAQNAPATTLAKPTQLTEPELAEDVTFTHIGTTADGKEEYELEASVNLPADDVTGQALPLNAISLMRTEGTLNLDSVENATIDGAELNKDAVEVFTYPDIPTEDDEALIPDEVTGDVITLDIADANMGRTATVTATIYANERASRNIEWDLYNGVLPLTLNNIEVEGGAPIAPNGPVPADRARVVVQVAGDKLLSGTNGTTRASGPNGERLERVFQNTPGEGAVLRLYAPLNDNKFGMSETATAWEQGARGENARPINQPWATCTADANGECVFEIPRGNGADIYDYYWVVMEQASPGYKVQDWVRLGVSGDTDTGRARILRHAYPTPLLKGGQIYYSGAKYKRISFNRDGYGSDWGDFDSASFMYEETTGQYQGALGGHVPYRSSLGSFTQVRENPAMPETCGLKAALIVDTSGSMGTSMDVMRDVVGSVIDGLAETSTELGLYSFATTSPSDARDLPNMDPKPTYTPKGRAALKSWKNNLTTRRSSGATNWEDGLKQVAEYNAKNPNSPYDVVYFITDGNPTVYNNPSGSPGRGNSGAESEMRELEAAIVMSNTVKSQGSRVVAVGIPAKWPTFWGTPIPSKRLPNLEISELNLQAVSGGKGGVDERSLRSKDFVFFTEQDVFKQALLNSLNLPCQVTVERRFYEGDDENVVPNFDNTRGTNVETNANQWEFAAEMTPTSGPEEQQSKVPDSVNKLGDNNQTGFPLNRTTGYTQIDIKEPAGKIPSGWIRMDAGPNGERAQCSTKAGKPVTTTALESEKTNDFRLKDVPVNGGIHCVVYYRIPSEPPQPGTFKFKLNKVDAQDTTIGLEGAEFKLEGLDENNAGEHAPSTVEDAGVGEFNWTELKTGRYKLSETKAADGGYILLAQPVFFRVARDGDATKLYVLENESDQTGIELTEENKAQIITFPIVGIDQTGSDNEAMVTMKLANTKGGELPKTGGTGVFVQVMISLLIMTAGAAAARTMRRAA